MILLAKSEPSEKGRDRMSSAACPWSSRAASRRLPTLAALAVALVGAGVAAGIHLRAQEGIVKPPEGLAIEGMPPVPARIAAAMAPYGQYRRATFRSWHPVRREMLIATRFGDTDQIHRVVVPGGARTQLTFIPGGLGGGQVAPYRFSYQQATGAFIVFQKDESGKENFQNYRLDLATRAVTRLTDGVSRNTLGVWSRRGDRLAYSSTRRNGKDWDLYVMDPADPSTDRRIAEVEGRWDAVDWTPDDRAVLALETRSAAESYLWRVEVATGERTLLTPKGPEPVSFADAAVARDGRTVYLTTDRDSDFLRLARLDLRTGRLTVLTETVAGDVEEFALAPDDSLVAFVVNENGLGVLHLLDLATGRERPVLKLPVGIVSNLRWHRNGVDLAFDLESPRMPRDVFSLDVRTGRVDRWTFSETGGLDPETLAEPEVVRWKSFDGLTISGILYRPPARFAGRRPVMINIHGGPERGQARPVWIGWSNYFLNELGVAILYPNVRGSSGFGKRFRDLDNGVRREDATRDIGALLDWIATRPDLDPARVMVTGASYGGYLTLSAFATYNDRLRCAFAGFPISSMVTELERTDPSRRDQRRPEYGDERDPAVRAVLERIAPLTNASKIRRPLFLAHGERDTRVPVSESRQMAAAVRENGAPLWLLVAQDEGHGFARQANVQYLMYAWAWFMEQYLVN
jgi:dipeptidyl aminopeptidase/acylaminoacyl peptidase